MRFAANRISEQMVNDDSSRTNEPTFHRGLEEFIPWALGHVSVGIYREGESEFFLQLTKRLDVGKYYLWNRNCITYPSRRYAEGPATDQNPRYLMRELHGTSISEAQKMLRNPLGEFEEASMRQFVRRYDRWLANNMDGSWTMGAIYPDMAPNRLGDAWTPGIRLIEGIDIDANYVIRHGEGRLWRMGVEHVGVDEFLHQLDLRPIDETRDAALYGTLSNMHDGIDYWTRVDDRWIHITKLWERGRTTLLVVTDSTSGEKTVLRVPSNLSTVLEAKAWTFGVQPDEYVPALET